MAWPFSGDRAVTTTENLFVPTRISRGPSYPVLGSYVRERGCAKELCIPMSKKRVEHVRGDEATAAWMNGLFTNRQPCN